MLSLVTSKSNSNRIKLNNFFFFFKLLARSDDKESGPRNLNEHCSIETGSAHILSFDATKRSKEFCSVVRFLSFVFVRRNQIVRKNRKKRGFGRLEEWGQDKYMTKS